MKSDKERMTECLGCEFIEECFRNIPDPEENPDGTCMTKDIIKERCGSGKFK